MIHLEYYRIFYQVAVSQSITRAAEQLYISQPAVTKAIHKLEKELNCRLFTRTSHGSLLTEEGTLLFYHVSRAMKEFETGEEKINQPESLGEQPICIGVTESALYSVLIPAISSYREKYPHSNFQIKCSSTSELLFMLGSEEIDIALGVTPIPQNTTVSILELREVRDIFFAHRDFPVDDSIPLTPQLLCTLPIVGVGQGSSAGSHITAYFRGLGLSYTPAFTVETSTNVLPFVENGLAIGLAPEWTLQVSTCSENLRKLNTSFSIPARKIFLAFRTRRLLSPACRNFIDTNFLHN